MMKISSLPSKLSLLLFLTGLALAANPSPAWALQAHAGPEGLYVHQGAHIFLAFAMLIFAVNIQRSPLVRQKAWRLLATSAILFILWLVLNRSLTPGHLLLGVLLALAGPIGTPGPRCSTIFSRWTISSACPLFSFFTSASSCFSLSLQTRREQKEIGNHDDLAPMAALDR
jgi:hypothetical protein